MSSIKDSNLASEGAAEVSWAQRQMQVLEEIKSEFAEKKTFRGIKHWGMYARYQRNSKFNANS